MSDPILRDLRLVSDETLFARLVLLRQRFPADSGSEDWIYRCDTWELANKAVRAEIRRRKATPPTWWVQAQPPPRRLPLLTTGAVFLLLLTLAVLGFALAPSY